MADVITGALMVGVGVVAIVAGTVAALLAGRGTNPGGRSWERW